jgi:hypothetical protein
LSETHGSTGWLRQGERAIAAEDTTTPHGRLMRTVLGGQADIARTFNVNPTTIERLAAA